VTASVPVVLSVVAILILLSPVFINLEYRRPGFPPDQYGFTTNERLYFGNQTRRYLISPMTLEDLRALRFEDGEPIYIQRELDHLQDVKIVLRGVLIVFLTAGSIMILSAAYAHFFDGWKGYRMAISRGGWLTAGLIGLILLLSVVSFQVLFTNFHLVFFKGDSWLFYYSDTLIRLFPIRFWQDVFLVFGLITSGGGILLGWLLGKKAN
jgi:integral membrane protein (TIGR01906 family)